MNRSSNSVQCNCRVLFHVENETHTEAGTRFCELLKAAGEESD